MNAVVTGVAAFIRSHLAEYLMAQGHQAVGIDCFTDYYPRWMKERNLANLGCDERLTFIEADLLNLDLVALVRGDLWVQSRPTGVIDYVFCLPDSGHLRHGPDPLKTHLFLYAGAIFMGSHVGAGHSAKPAKDHQAISEVGTHLCPAPETLPAGGHFSVVL